MGYDQGVIESFRNRLLDERVKLMALQQRNGQPIAIEDIHRADRVEMAAATTDNQKQKTKEALIEHWLADVDRALGKADDGTYGICPECGQLIQLARLEAFPAALLCVLCHAAKVAKKR